MQKWLLFIVCLSALLFTFTANAASNNIEALILKGDFIAAQELITKKLNSANLSLLEKAHIYHLQGNIQKIAGNIDEGLISWQQASNIRDKVYLNKKDYHHAWKYAHLSNYHYEKINTKLAVEYADSCLQLIAKITVTQQQEIEIFKIWNILGQSYKQDVKRLTAKQIAEKYKQIQAFYLKSVNFIQTNKLEKHYLAQTYHLLGNSYTDFTWSDSSEKKLSLMYQNASEYYNKAIYIWKEIYGKEHFELARTYFVQGLLNNNVRNRLGFNSQKKAINFFELALKAYGIDLNDTSKTDGDKIPNKEDFLMTCKHLTFAYFSEFDKDKSNDWIKKAERINQIAVKTWEKIHGDFKGSNTNQNLAIYNLVPFSETITIELMKKQQGLDYALNSIFSANQKLKYYDLLKYGNRDNPTAISSIELQKRLKNNEVFLDFHFKNSTTIIVLKITNQTTELIELPYLKYDLVGQYSKAIERLDFETYTKTAHKIYQTLIKPCKVDDQNLILCLDGWLNNIPFESLLTSTKNWDKKDYRQLDYLLMHHKIQYVLNPQFFRKEQSKPFNFKVETYIPENSAYSSLPFSQKLGGTLQGKFKAQTHLFSNAKKRNFLNSTGAIVHLSGHGVISSENTLGNYLVFSDSLLYLEDLTSFRNIPALMVLNTCNSANGKMFYGEGINGFVRAFHSLKTSCTICNLWEVDDQVSNVLFEHFYDFLSSGKSTNEALRLAQLEQIQQAKSSNLASPYYWAAHQLTGEEIVFEQENKQSKMPIYWLFFIPIIAVGIIRWRRKKLKST